MPEVIAPAAFNEKFTLYLNTEGKPVQRTLREMTVGEATRAIEWQMAEVIRLEHEAEPFEPLIDAMEDGTLDPNTLMTDLPLAEASAAFLALGNAQGKTARLMQLMAANMPQWKSSQITLGNLRDALRRYWPGGRAA